MSSILLSAKKTPIMEIEDIKKTIDSLQQNLSNLSLKLAESNKEEMHSIINANVIKYEKKIKTLNKKLKTNQTKITKLNKQLKEKDKTIKSLEEQLTEKDTNIKSLESLLENLQKDPKKGNKIPQDVDKVTENFKSRYDVDYMPNIDNLKVIASYRYSTNPRDEYSMFHSGEFELSYDFVKGNNNVISVKYIADYNSTQTVDNRGDPYVEFESSLKVSPNLHYTYHKDELIEYYEPTKDEDEDEDEDEDKGKWCDLMNKVLDDICCDVNYFSDLLQTITEDGKYSSEN